jgi:hypothetical protein
VAQNIESSKFPILAFIFTLILWEELNSPHRFNQSNNTKKKNKSEGKGESEKIHFKDYCTDS